MEKLIFQDIVESRLEKRTKGVYVPVGGKILIAFMDDFNMPMKEIYGSQPPLELIRQWIGYGFWCVSNPSANYFIVVEVSSLKLIKKEKKKVRSREADADVHPKVAIIGVDGPAGRWAERYHESVVDQVQRHQHDVPGRKTDREDIRVNVASPHQRIPLGGEGNR